jgi:DNA modification methylase
MITPGEAQEVDGVFVYATKGYDWSQHEDESVHGIVMESSLDSLDEITEAHRVLKPGGHMLLANDLAEPTGHSGACFAEDTGFEVRDCIMVADAPEDSLHYVAKAARREREAGLDHFPEQVFGMSGGAQGAIARAEDGEDGEEVETPGGQDIGLNRVKKRRNIHPTVKPYAVMERLLQDVPKDVGPVVDPFMGSGTTGIACVQTGHDFIGIEREAEYLNIAEARVRHWNTRDAGWTAAVVESDGTAITEAREAEPETLTLDDLFGL